MTLAERRLEEAIKRVDPELTEYIRRDPYCRARCASIIAQAHLREARRRRVEPAQKYLDLQSAAAPWVSGDALPGSPRRSPTAGERPVAFAASRVALTRPH